MRRKYISPEFDYNKVYGTYNMVEKNSFFGSKMLEIDDVININSKNIIYYQKDNHEQIDYNIESKFNPMVFDVVSYKLKSHIISIDESQSSFQKDDKTKWIVKISIGDILLNYLFATLKEHRTFEGVSNSMNIYNDVDVAIKNYIYKNVSNRYKFKTIDLFLSYKDLNNQQVLKYKNDFSQFTEKSQNKLNKMEVILDHNDNQLEIKFNQEKPSNEYAFDYYFNLNFEKI